MYLQKLTFSLCQSHGIPEPEQVLLLKKVGFDGFSLDNSSRNSPIAELAAIAKKENMIIPSLHAPFNKSDDMWNPEEIGDIAMCELLDNLEICAKHEIPAMVVHTFLGMEPDEESIDESIGIERYGAVAVRASELGINLALENTEGEKYLAILMNSLKSEKSVGFCWDTGHELCYNHSEDMMALYGDKLLCTHLNDNLGIRNFEGKITWHDDLHLLPFDGITDWHSVAKRIVKHSFNGPLNFELSRVSKPDRHENDVYSEVSAERYFTEAYNRACRVAALVIAERK